MTRPYQVRCLAESSSSMTAKRLAKTCPSTTARRLAKSSPSMTARLLAKTCPSMTARRLTKTSLCMIARRFAQRVPRVTAPRLTKASLRAISVYGIRRSDFSLLATASVIDARAASIDSGSMVFDWPVHTRSFVATEYKLVSSFSVVLVSK